MTNNFIDFDSEGRAVISDAQLAGLETQFVRATAGGNTNTGRCDKINPEACTNDGDCRGSTNSQFCSNVKTCALGDSDGPLG